MSHDDEREDEREPEPAEDAQPAWPPPLPTRGGLRHVFKRPPERPSENRPGAGDAA